MDRTVVTVLGECVADAIMRPGSPMAFEVHAGGGPANTAVALARLGGPTRLLARISTDVFGRMFTARFAGAGVDTTGCVTAAEPSTLALAELDESGRATYNFYADGCADWQWTEAELTAETRRASGCLHTGSLALVREPGGRRIESYLESVRDTATICIDPNVRPQLVPPALYRERIPRWCSLADIVRVSEDDLVHLAPDETAHDAFARWHAAGARLIVLTLGERGALASLDGRQVAVPGLPVEVVDTVGAGDAFTGGLLHHLAGQGQLGGRLDRLRVEDVEAACAHAVRVAAATCAVAGAEPPWGSDLDCAVATPAVQH